MDIRPSPEDGRICLFVILCVCISIKSNLINNEGLKATYRLLNGAIWLTDFSAEDKDGGVKFCTAVYRHPGQGISH